MGSISYNVDGDNSVYYLVETRDGIYISVETEKYIYPFRVFVGVEQTKDPRAIRLVYWIKPDTLESIERGTGSFHRRKHTSRNVKVNFQGKGSGPMAFEDESRFWSIKWLRE